MSDKLYVIKPLEWEYETLPRVYKEYWSETVIGTYVIEKQLSRYDNWSGWKLSFHPSDPSRHRFSRFIPYPKKGKEIAWKHYQKKLLEALTPYEETPDYAKNDLN